jgi:hypothetical protein
MDPLTRGVKELRFTDCLGDHCRIYDSCQGKYSQAARNKVIIALLESLKGIPFIGSDVKKAIDTTLGLLIDPQATA